MLRFTVNLKGAALNVGELTWFRPCPSSIILSSFTARKMMVAKNNSVNCLAQVKGEGTEAAQRPPSDKLAEHSDVVNRSHSESHMEAGNRFDADGYWSRHARLRKMPQVRKDVEMTAELKAQKLQVGRPVFATFPRKTLYIPG